MERTHRFLTYVKEQMKRKLPFLSKPFRETVETNLYDIFFSVLFFLLFGFFMFIIAVYASQTETDLSLVNAIFIVSVAVLSVSYWFFNLLYVGLRILPKIENSRPAIKYLVLRVRNWSLRTVLVSITITFGTLILIGLISGLGLLRSDFISHKVTTVGFDSFLTFGLIAMAFGLASGPTDSFKDLNLSFDAIQDFENIASEIKPPQESCIVWNLCLRYSINNSEDTLKLHLGISEDFPSDFYEPFNIISLAAIAGSNELKGKAKEWMASLGHILMEKRISYMTRTKLVIEHLEKVDSDSSLCDFRYMCEKYGIKYDFSPGWKRMNKALGRTGRIAIIITPIATLIVGILPYVLPYLSKIFEFT